MYVQSAISHSRDVSAGKRIRSYVRQLLFHISSEFAHFDPQITTHADCTDLPPLDLAAHRPYADAENSSRFFQADAPIFILPIHFLRPSRTSRTMFLNDTFSF